MMIWRTLVLVGLFPVLGPAWQKPKTFSVEFFLTDGYGTAIASGVRVQIISDSGTSSHWLNYPENRKIDLPAGRYTAVIEAAGFLPSVEQLTLADRDVFLPVPLTLAPIEGTEISAAKNFGARLQHGSDWPAFTKTSTGLARWTTTEDFRSNPYLLDSMC